MLIDDKRNQRGGTWRPRERARVLTAIAGHAPMHACRIGDRPAFLRRVESFWWPAKWNRERT